MRRTILRKLTSNYESDTRVSVIVLRRMTLHLIFPISFITYPHFLIQRIRNEEI